MVADYPYSSASRTRNKDQIDFTVKGGANTSPTSNPTPTVTHGTNVPLWKIDMGRQSHFTVSIRGMNRPNMKHNTYGSFLPVKSLNYTPVSLDHLHISTGIFSDLAIPQHRKMGKIELEIQDTSDHFYENMFFTWYDKLVPDDNGYIGYFMDFVKTFEYREFNHKGELTKTYYMEVMPEGDLRVNRSYDANEIQSFTVSLGIVGIITSTNAGQQAVTGGAGAGGTGATPNYLKDTSAMIVNINE